MYRSILHLLAVALPAAALVTYDPCRLVESKIPGRISYPGSTTYNASVSSYYDDQERSLRPGCIFRPTNTSEVSQFVKLMTADKRKPQFAVRGGGHTLWTGAANIGPGITVDMRLMDQLELSEDKKIARIGGGAVWDHIYPQLVPHDLTVMGGRIPGIGVGGFATGGGITFSSREHGFSCDNIYGYEVVLGNGQVIYADKRSHPDLWLALKGGSNNFGIITRFDVATIPQGKMWYNHLHYNYTDSALQAHAEAFSDFMKPENHDGAAMMGVFLDYLDGNFLLHDALWYTREVENPAVYDAFTEIPNLGGVAELNTIDNVVDKFGDDIPAQVGRAFQLTFSFHNPDPTVYMELFKIWETGLSKIANVEGLFIEFLTQPHPVTNGTNLFGLTPGRTDDVMVDMTAAYANQADDRLVQSVITDIVDEQRALLKRTGHLMDFIYLNYADISQDVLQSWGADNVAKLRAASDKYDPKGVFQKQVPGGFKIPK
ncbi:FAD-binding oxidoreductase [Aspergillus foveolatus]|uniref:FAD-binding oxidoreductase n=1 Tax=Aspergillus foveolatus TaxID=210207 RepID=UPI003CCD9B4B